MIWKPAAGDRDLIVSGAWFIRRCPKEGRFLLGHDVPAGSAQCLGGFPSADAARAAAAAAQEAGRVPR